jgi:hypothetical protein
MLFYLLRRLTQEILLRDAVLLVIENFLCVPEIGLVVKLLLV